jgi:hypothetical protein
MTDQDRILNLLAQGKISKQEAAELLEALDASEEFSLANPEVTIIDVDPIPPLPPQPEAPQLPMPPVPPALSQVEKELSAVTRAKAIEERAKAVEAQAKAMKEETNDRHQKTSDSRPFILNLRALSGDITVFSDSELKEPQIDSEGKIKIQKENDSWNVDANSDDVTVILPENWGINLHVQSGDVTLNDLAFVQGRIISGDVHIDHTGSVDLSLDSGDIHVEKAEALKLRVLSGDVNLDDVGTVELSLDSGNVNAENIKVLKSNIISGDVNAEGIGILDIQVDDGDLNVERVALFKSRIISGDINAEYIKSLDVSIDAGNFCGNVLLHEGAHSLQVTSGDVDITLLEGSSVTYQASVTSGDINVTTAEGSYTSDNSYQGKVDEGKAQLAIHVDSGDVRLSTEKSKGKKNLKFKVGGASFEIDFDFGKTFSFKGFDFGPKHVETPPNLRWIHIDSWAGDADISSDAALREPQVNNGNLQRHDDGTWKLSSLTDDLSLKIPTDYGVILSVKAGDVTVSDVPFIKGRVFAGDFTARNIGGVDVFVAAGDVNASLLVKEGQHHLSAAAGSLSLKFLKGSNVKYQGSNGFGFGHFGKHMNGIIGEGKATMTIRTLVADADVVVEE